MNRERLENAIRVLKQVREDNFNMRLWYSGGRSTLRAAPKENTDCGFVACAVGHMAMDPWFNAQGLELELLDDDVVYVPAVNGNTRGCAYARIAEFFDIRDVEGARHLFSQHSYAGGWRPVKPAQVIERIEKLLQAEPKDEQHYESAT